ncbi:hypothetical protein ECANGB1_2043 [Enterospora canceri]|uniref:Uncharacterized protein n=1 Tax=Enterospora canceri TaxID=1081671 RepID=A0A1Y1S534_9MICR|nr:hypothetical protein ECANGB1_2043 [Enterospora canceri]
MKVKSDHIFFAVLGIITAVVVAVASVACWIVIKKVRKMKDEMGKPETMEPVTETVKKPTQKLEDNEEYMELNKNAEKLEEELQAELIREENDYLAYEHKLGEGVDEEKVMAEWKEKDKRNQEERVRRQKELEEHQIKLRKMREKAEVDFKVVVKERKVDLGEFKKPIDAKQTYATKNNRQQYGLKKANEIDRLETVEDYLKTRSKDDFIKNNMNKIRVDAVEMNKTIGNYDLTLHTLLIMEYNVDLYNFWFQKGFMTEHDLTSDQFLKYDPANYDFFMNDLYYMHYLFPLPLHNDNSLNKEKPTLKIIRDQFMGMKYRTFVTGKLKQFLNTFIEFMKDAQSKKNEDFKSGRMEKLLEHITISCLFLNDDFDYDLYGNFLGQSKDALGITSEEKPLGHSRKKVHGYLDNNKKLQKYYGVK